MDGVSFDKLRSKLVAERTKLSTRFEAVDDKITMLDKLEAAVSEAKALIEDEVLMPPGQQTPDVKGKKMCQRCKKAKNLHTDFHRASRLKDGRASWCKDCVSEYQKTKTCRKCGAHKPKTEFNRDRASRDGRFGWCRPCSLAQSRKYYGNKGK